MKKILPIFLLVFTLFLGFFVFTDVVFAEAPTPDVWATAVRDPEVTFVGKVGARAGKFLDWAIAGYKWVRDPDLTSLDPAGKDPAMTIRQFWSIIRNIVYAFCLLFVLITAFVIITTRGKSITFMRFLPRFVVIVLLITFSFAIIQFIYQITDVIQGFFFLNANNQIISQKDLLYVGFNYDTFEGFRLPGATYDESMFISLLLVKFTAITYYAMVGMLLMRKIILWFFIIVSPILPILLLYYPLRNTAKIWIGEFFRWLLYAPIFAIFLQGLVRMWVQSSPATSGIPVLFNFTKEGAGTTQLYPTAINILLGGPGQTVSIQNSVNLPSTFALYVVALLMLWVVILLPWILLQIFLNYFHAFSFSENNVIKQILNTSTTLFNKKGAPIIPPPAPVSPPPPSSYRTGGMAKEIPFASKIEIPEMKVAPKGQAMTIPAGAAQVLRLANLSVPTMRDIARYETSLQSRDIRQHVEVSQMRETLAKIANPRVAAVPSERERFSQFRETLVKAKEKGDILANSILSASHLVATPLAKADERVALYNVLQKIANPASISSATEREKFSQLRERLTQESRQGNTLATTILSATEKQVSASAVSELREKLISEREKGNVVASAIMSTAETARETAFVPNATVVLKEVLQRISNPDLVTSLGTSERQQYIELRERLTQESSQGNTLATTILSETKTEPSLSTVSELRERLVKERDNSNTLATMILATSESALSSVTKEQTEKIVLKDVLSKIANPQAITIPEEKQQYTKLHEKLIQESQKGNNLATTILNATEKEINLSQLSELREKLIQERESGNVLATTILSQVDTTMTSMSQENDKLVLKEVLERLVNPERVTDLTDRQRYVELKEKLTQESQKGDTLATTILTSSQTQLGTSAVSELREKLIQEKDKGNILASAILGEGDKLLSGAPVVSPVFPQVNKVQTVSLDDYEAVKKMWQESYQKGDVPKAVDNKERKRIDWIKEDVTKINETINLLTSADPHKVKEGMAMVSRILPILLIGGFSQTEVVTYLKAKQEAGKATITDLEKEEEKEETMLPAEKKKKEEPRVMTAEEEVADENTGEVNKGNNTQGELEENKNKGSGSGADKKDEA